VCGVRCALAAAQQGERNCTDILMNERSGQVQSERSRPTHTSPRHSTLARSEGQGGGATRSADAMFRPARRALRAAASARVNLSLLMRLSGQQNKINSLS